MPKRVCENKCINGPDKIILLNSIDLSIGIIKDQLKESLGKTVKDMLNRDLNNFTKAKDNLNITPECR